jgi:hypothetical protein
MAVRQTAESPEPGRERDPERTKLEILDVEHLDPVAAIRRLAELTFDHHESHPDFIRLVSIENIHHAEHMAKVTEFVQLNNPAINLIAHILEQGRANGVFHRQIDAIDIHMIISALCCFRVANRHTFGAIFGRDMVDPDLRSHYRTMLGDLVVEYLTSKEPESGTSTSVGKPGARPRRRGTAKPRPVATHPQYPDHLGEQI